MLQFGILLATNVIVSLLVMIVVLAASVPARLRASLGLTVFSLLLWQDLVFISNVVTGNLLFWNHAVFIWPAVALLSFFVFVYFLNKQNVQGHTRRVKTIEASLFGLLCVGFVVQLASIGAAHIFVIDTDGQLLRGVGYPVFLCGLVLSFIAVLAYLGVSVYATRHSAQHGRAMHIVLHTVLITILYGAFVNALLPVLTNSQQYASFGVLTVVVFAIGLTHSIVSARLLDIKLYAVRTVAYVFSLLTLALLYGFLAYAASNFIIGYAYSPSQVVINVIFALILALVFQPIKAFFDQITNTVFYHGSYDTSKFYGQLSRVLAATSHLNSLLEQTARFIGINMKADVASFFVYHHDGRLVAGSPKIINLPKEDARQIDIYAAQKGIIETLHVEDSHMKRLLVSHAIHIVLPLRYEERIIGYFLLGQQQVGSYAPRDIRTLETISDELALAVQNALSVHAVRELNDHLEQRIESATKELRASNAQLQKLDEAKDEFISMASHQLRTPLTSIKGYISMLLEGDAGALSAEQKRMLSEVFVSSERMVHLIGDFLNVSRLQTGKFVIDKHPVDMALLVRHELDGLAATAAARNIKFSYTMPKNIPELTLDESKIQQVVMNFADNAIYYSKDGGTITVRLKKTAEYVELTVKDTGIGVPVAEQSQLFTKFFRATNARKARPDGTGVGLFLAKKVIEEHDGTILFESKEGKGSIFGFRVPLNG